MPNNFENIKTGDIKICIYHAQECAVNCCSCETMARLVSFTEKDVLFQHNASREMMSLIAGIIRPIGGRIFQQVAKGKFKKIVP